MEALNLMENGDIFQQEYKEIKTIVRNYFRANGNKNRSVRSLNYQPSNLVMPSISRFELGTMMDDMKFDILHSLTMQMETIQLKMKKEEVEKAPAIFCPRCRKKHENNEFPLDTI